ncbi:alpha/beta-hydrolase [Mytilinidion resinicola]|uniref:Alpha/beta-hydrolase n=1 Tax=Mytilinidion resinicola TaxID=574789 RepID=A0A6A6YI01_9PEZI|nr:alpha/beta-hydrolase [Mytilinidion resinicola]KAF2808188.1 alpha/beta-hydrolase [Mytilinidion resinicola]
MLSKASTSILSCVRLRRISHSVRECGPRYLEPSSLLPLSYHRLRRRVVWPCIPAIEAYKRHFSSIAIVPVITPPVVFVGLALTLWFYKCCMMILFQNKIIYMPSAPPYSRREKIADYARMCGSVHWEEQRITSLDGTRISLCIGRLRDETTSASPRQSTSHVVVLYFQGNASSIPPRLPTLSKVLSSLNSGNAYTLVAVSYRGFWTSQGRASQRGIEMDADAAIAWAQTHFKNHLTGSRPKLVLWGQSIGASVAAGAASRLLHANESRNLQLSGIILETPFVSIKRMLTSLYPQKWLPYRYLSPFLWNWWDNEEALRTMATISVGGSIPILLITAARDEIVPSDQADDLQRLCQQLNFKLTRHDIQGALHTEATLKSEGKEAVVKFLKTQISSDHADDR